MSLLFGWRKAIAASDLTPMQRLAAYTLSLHMDADGGSCWPSLPTLEAETGLDRRTLQRALRSLHERGYLDRKIGRGRGHSTRYSATFPGGEKGASVPPFRGEEKAAAMRIKGGAGARKRRHTAAQGRTRGRQEDVTTGDKRQQISNLDRQTEANLQRLEELERERLEQRREA